MSGVGDELAEFGDANKLIETPLVVLGGLALAGAHLINRKLCKHCERCEAHAH